MKDPRTVIERTLCFSGKMSPAATAITKQILEDLAESGMAIVPVEPTEAMVTAGIYADQNIGVEGVWRHMLRTAQETGT